MTVSGNRATPPGSLLDARSKPRLLDLFCGAGGAAVGYSRAGFEVVGVDNRPQPHYPFEFVQRDALEVLDEMISEWGDPDGRDPDFSAIHASPPCQSFTAYRRKGHGVGDGYRDLIDPVRALLVESGLPYVIENVPGAPLRWPVTLCGSMFDLHVRRHRLFETNFLIDHLPVCSHKLQESKGKRFPGATNREGRYTCEVGVYRIPLATQKEAMGVDWDVTLDELSEMVPPDYTQQIGLHLRAHLRDEETARAVYAGAAE